MKNKGFLVFREMMAVYYETANTYRDL